MNKSTVEWIVLPGDIAIVATETGQVWQLALGSFGENSPFKKEMVGKGSARSTAALLNQAIAAGFGHQEQDSADEAISLPQYVYNLVGTYHNARRTPENYLLAAKQMRALGRPEIASYLEMHALEETGHDRLIIKDLTALGLPAERLVAGLIPDGVKILVEIFDFVLFIGLSDRLHRLLLLLRVYRRNETEVAGRRDAGFVSPRDRCVTLSKNT